MDFFQTVKQIGVFMICAQVILHFRPSVKYEKYLKLLISVMVLVQIIIPAVNLFTGRESKDFYMAVEKIQSEIDENMKQLEIENAINEENILNQTLEEIKSRINNITNGEGVYVTKAEYDCENGENILVLCVQDKQHNQDIDIRIDSINVGEQAAMGRAVTSYNDGNEEKIHALCNLTSKELGVPKEQIKVVWDE